jgi:uncharacterized protein (DUF885 family)
MISTEHTEQRDRFAFEVIAFHEAVPGHHHQGGVAQQLSQLPLIRRVARSTCTPRLGPLRRTPR